MNPKQLIEQAQQARLNAYAPHSEFRVGAALLCEDGRVFLGCNVENAAYSPSLCAERVAISSAVAAGCRDFVAIAIVGGKEDTASPCFPCGVCRQVLKEFCKDDFSIHLWDGETVISYSLGELLPHSFSL